MRPIALARKYAHALFLQAEAAKQVDVVRESLESILSVTRSYPDVAEVLSHPRLAADKKQALIQSLVGVKGSDLMRRFLDLLIQKQRLSLLDLIVREFIEESDRLQGVVSFDVVSAYPLKPAAEKVLIDSLSKQLGQKIRLDVKVQPELIGGLMAQSRDHVLDLSLAGRLRKLEQSFLTN